MGLSSLLTRSTNDVGQIQGFLFISLTMVVTAPLMLVGALALSLAQGWRMAPVIVVSGGLLAVVVAVFIRRLMPWAAGLQGRLDRVNRLLREQLRGIPVIRTFRQEDRERARFAVENDELTRTALHLGRIQVLMLPVITIVSNLTSVTVSALGALFADAGHMQIGEITATIGYLAQILLAVSMLTAIAAVLPRAVTCAGRITDVLDTETPAPGDPGVENDSRPPAIVFDGVTVAFPGAEAPAVDAVSLICEPGTVTGLIGGTGSGKSTLLSTVLRFADPSSGIVSWDGRDIRLLAPAWVRERSAFVGQGTALITGTVADNLRIGRPGASEDELWAALEVAAAADFVRERSGGLGAAVAQEGRNFSGGQRQRLDEATSAADPRTELLIQRALNRLRRSTTTLVITHRMATAALADQIVVLEDGRVVECGTHTELLAAGGTYARRCGVV